MMLSYLKRIRIIHRLRVSFALLGFLSLLAAAGGLWWANHTGLPNSWRSTIEDALASRGLVAEVASLSYRPLRGIEAGEVIVYADKSKSRVIARLHELFLDIDRTKLARGEVEIDRIDLSGARISLAADPQIPDSETIEITDAKGSILISQGRQLEIRDASGMIDGIRLEFDAAVKRYRPRPSPSPEEIEYARIQRRALFTNIIDALEKWAPESAAPPRVTIKASGDLEEPSSMRASIQVQGSRMQSQSLNIQSLNLAAELRGSVITVREIDVETSTGSLAGSFQYDSGKREGSFDGRSSLDIAALMRSLNLSIPDRFPTFGNPPEIEARGSFLKGDEGWRMQLLGNAVVDQPRFEDIAVDRASSDFSWDGERLFLEDIEIQYQEKSLTGRVFITPEEILYEARTNLPLEFCQNAVKIQPLSKILNSFSGGEDTTISVDFKGSSVPGNRQAWTFSGDAAATNIAYRGVPAKRAKVTLDLKRARLDFVGGEVEFDYRDYPLRKAHGGPKSGVVRLDLIRWDREPSTITVRNLKGEAWPGPIARTFSPSLAEKLETYGFHSNPGLEANGIIGVKHGLPKQDLTVKFGTKKPSDYKFLGETLELEAARGTVRVLPETVKISNLSFGLLGGFVRGTLESQTRGDKMVSGELDWTKISLPQLSRTYGYESEPEGQVTGRIDFDLVGGDVKGLNGSGHVGLEDGELFEVPIFGPLSPVISAVLGRRKAGFQEASEAFCTFNLENGILRTLDFRTTTSSIVLTGDATVDLSKQSMQMTVRMNARGLLGLITLPLRPFYGMFQFRGIGPIQKPVWKNVMFTKPPKPQQESLLEPPKALRVNPPRD